MRGERLHEAARRNNVRRATTPSLHRCAISWPRCAPAGQRAGAARSQELSKSVCAPGERKRVLSPQSADACFAAQWGVTLKMGHRQVKGGLGRENILPLETSMLKIGGKSMEQWRYETFSIYFEKARSPPSNNTRLKRIRRRKQRLRLRHKALQLVRRRQRARRAPALWTARFAQGRFSTPARLLRR